MSTATPAMRQYLDAKEQHRDALLLFRMGDFYEIFYEDALVASRVLELTLTSRSKEANGNGIPMCGVPYHAVDGYIARLVKRGFRVAICDQVEDPRKAKGLVKREVVRVVSPGTLTDANYLDAREPAFLMAISPMGRNASQPDGLGVALLDVSTENTSPRACANGLNTKPGPTIMSLRHVADSDRRPSLPSKFRVAGLSSRRSSAATSMHTSGGEVPAVSRDRDRSVEVPARHRRVQHDAPEEGAGGGVAARKAKRRNSRGWTRVNTD